MTARLAVSIAIAVAVGAVAFALLAPGGDGGDAGGPVEPRASDAGWSDEGRRVFAAMGCGSCHRLAAAGSTGTIGPSLDERLAGHDRESLVNSIVRAPRGNLTAMPPDYGERMTEADLDALVTFLLASR
jgi:mono/diheme cytochrome c family protein